MHDINNKVPKFTQGSQYVPGAYINTPCSLISAFLFSSPKPKAYRCAYRIDRRPPSVRCPVHTFQRSSFLKPLGQAKPTFTYRLWEPMFL